MRICTIPTNIRDTKETENIRLGWYKYEMVDRNNLDRIALLVAVLPDGSPPLGKIHSFEIHPYIDVTLEPFLEFLNVFFLISQSSVT